jgi:plastocyanin
MSRIRFAAVCAAAAATLAVPVSAPAQRAQLVGVVGTNDAFVITLTRAGQRVRSLKAGTYRLTIRDRSAIHNYRISGPGMNRAFTTVPARTTRTFTVRFRPGTYRFVCDPHVATMSGRFTVRR